MRFEWDDAKNRVRMFVSTAFISQMPLKCSVDRSWPGPILAKIMGNSVGSELA
jgi:hypothetical protein